MKDQKRVKRMAALALIALVFMACTNILDVSDTLSDKKASSQVLKGIQCPMKRP